MQNRLIILIIIVSLVIGTCTLTRGQEWGDDFASYILQAKSIWDGETEEFVQRNSFTVLESSHEIGPIAYPWGYPLILTPIYAAKGRSPLPLKIPGLVFFGGFLICMYLLAKSRLNQTQSLLLVSLFAFNPMLLEFLDYIVSDIPFLFFSTLTLLLLIHPRIQSTKQKILLGAVIFLAFFIRATGILLLGSFIASEILMAGKYGGDHNAAKRTLWNVGLVSGVFSLLWILSRTIFPSGSESYLLQLEGFEWQTFPSRIRSQLWLFSLFFGNAVNWQYLYYVSFVFFLIGLWGRKVSDLVFIILFVLWIAILAVWPFWQGARFIFPLLPIFIYFAFEGVNFAISKLPQRYRSFGNMVFYGCCLSIVGIFFVTSITHAYQNIINDRQINGPYDIYSVGVYDFIKDQTPSDSIVIFFKPRAMHLMTDHDSVLVTECDRLWLGDYIVLSKKAENSQIPIEDIASCKVPIDDVFENRRFIIYEIQK